MQKMPIPSEAEPEPEPPEGLVFASVLRTLVKTWEVEATQVGQMAEAQRSKELEHVSKTIGRAAAQLKGLVEMAVPIAGFDKNGWPEPVPTVDEPGEN